MAGGVDPTGIVQEISQAIFGSAITASKNWLGYIQTYNENIQKMRNLHRTLENCRQEIAHRVKLGNMQNEEVVTEVKEWLQDLDVFLGPDKSWNKLLVNENVRKEAEKCCFGYCWSPKYRHDISKLAEVKGKEVEDRIEKMRARGNAPVTLPPVQIPKIGSFGSYYCPGLKSREEKVNQILELLKDDKVNRIGIFGMGGAGKTTLMLELARRAENDNLFNEIVMAEVSQFPDIRRVQDQIADRIHFSLDRYHSIEERAINLGKRLRQIKLLGNKLQDDEQYHPSPEWNQGEEKGQNPRVRVEDVEKKARTEKKVADDAQNEVSSKEERMGAYDEKEVPVNVKKSNDDQIQSHVEKGGKLLVILDNMWRKFDLHLLGIPYELEKDLGCKIIVTSRSEDVCRVMDVASPNVFKVGDLSEDEAEHLFRHRVGVIADSKDYKPILDKLLKKCSRLPLSINILADTLKNQTLSVWEHILAQLEKPIPGETIGVLDDTYSIIEMSYNYLGKEDKKMFFLLCSIFPSGSSVRIIDLLRYGIGLGLFEYVNSIDEAISQAYKWANELKTLSLLSEVDSDKGEIFVHDDVREAGKSFAAKGGYVFHVGAIPRWLKQESYEKFVAISLMSNDNYEYLANRNLPNLRLLRSLCTCSTKLVGNHFSGMKSLKVLDLSHSDVEVLPSSIVVLWNLETLLLEHCSLKDIVPICQLRKLQVLSLRESSIVKIPIEFRKLEQLKLLDLTNCYQLNDIPVNVLCNLTQLEGLYMRNSFSSWGLEESMARLSELNVLPLHVLEIKIRSINQLPDGDFPALVLSSYKIDFVVSSVVEDALYSRSLQVGHLHPHDLIKDGWKPLVKNAESLYLENVHGLRNIAPYLGEYGLRDLKRLKVSNCSGMECLISGRRVYQLVVFPQLEKLYLESLPDLQAICHGKSPGLNLFSNLVELTLSSLHGLHYFALPIQHATKLRVLEVKSCKNLKYVFDASSEKGLPALQKLLLQGLKSLRALCVETSDGNEDDRHLISKKMVFSSLEKLKVNSLSEMVELWDMTIGEEFARTFPKLRSISIKYVSKLRHVWCSEYCKGSFIFTNLKKLKISGCHSMKTICPPSVARGFQSLELLRVKFCGVNQIIATESNEEDEGSIIADKTMPFTKLLKLELMYLSSLTYFYKGSMKIELPSLKTMTLDSLDCMETWAEVECSENEVDQERENPTGERVLFNGKAQFPSLEQMSVGGVSQITGLWDFTTAQHLSSSFPCLQLLSLRFMTNMQHVWKKELNVDESHGFLNFKDIEIYSCSSLESLFQTPAADSSKLMTVKFPALRTLKVIFCQRFKYVLEGNVHLQFPALKDLRLRALPVMKTFAKLEEMEVPEADTNGNGDDLLVPLFNRKIRFHSLEELKLKWLPKVNKLWDITTCEELTSTFPNLRTIDIGNLPKLRHVWIDDHSGEGVFIESLENMTIFNCDELESLFAPTIRNSTSTQELHYLKIISFPKLQKLKLDNLMKFKCLYEGSVTIDLESLKELTVKNLPMIKILVKVEKQSFEETSSIMQDDDGPVLFRGKGSVEFPSLKELTISLWPSLERIYETEEECSSARSSIYPTLRTMHLWGCNGSKLKQLPKSMLHQLTSLKISRFHRLKSLVSTNASTDGALFASFISVFEKLEQFTIEECDDMEVIMSEELHEEGHHEFVFPHLKQVELINMVSLSSFSSAKYTIQLPALASVSISECAMMRSFSLGPSNTPNLSKVEVDDKTIAKHGDLNTIIQCHFCTTAARYLPRTVQHMLHKQHILRLVIHFRLWFSCDGCGKINDGYSYYCRECDFDLHPKCALIESQLVEEPDEMKVAKNWPRILKHKLHESHELKLVAGRMYICNGCSQKGDELFSYYCSECDYVLHPKCALENDQMTRDPIQKNEHGNTDLRADQTDTRDTNEKTSAHAIKEQPT